jgi:hypothetical protein
MLSVSRDAISWFRLYAHLLITNFLNCHGINIMSPSETQRIKNIQVPPTVD